VLLPKPFAGFGWLFDHKDEVVFMEMCCLKKWKRRVSQVHPR